MYNFKVLLLILLFSILESFNSLGQSVELDTLVYSDSLERVKIGSFQIGVQISAGPSIKRYKVFKNMWGAEYSEEICPQYQLSAEFCSEKKLSFSLELNYRKLQGLEIERILNSNDGSPWLEDYFSVNSSNYGTQLGVKLSSFKKRFHTSIFGGVNNTISRITPSQIQYFYNSDNELDNRLVHYNEGVENTVSAMIGLNIGCTIFRNNRFEIISGVKSTRYLTAWTKYNESWTSVFIYYYGQDYKTPFDIAAYRNAQLVSLIEFYTRFDFKIFDVYGRKKTKK